MNLMPDFARMKHDLARLVAINTENPPGHELDAARYLHEVLQAEGFDLSLSEYKPGRVNVIATYPNGAGPTFAFNTHIDTVPAGEGWSTDPFVLHEADGKLFGRGSCDAKGPMAAMIEACRLLIAAKAHWAGTLMAVFTADEEIASEGAKHYVANQPPKIDFAVIGEPTSNTAFTAHKGSLRPLVRVHGVTAHSGTPHLGENAIYRAGQLLGLIEHHHEQVVKCKCHDLVGHASLTVTRIHGGHADNVVPGACDLLLDRRMVPGEDEAAVKAEIDALLALANERFGVRAEVIEYKPTTGGATQTALDAPIVQASLAACREHNHGNGGPFGFQGGCDLVHFRSLGTTGTVIGPGTLAVAHKPDEFVPIDEFIASASIYRDIALQMLRKGA
ncbi:M20 family metallopeptidase [Pseudomonas typographi]|uniref:M20 family metallopeptidase n=1 Tax=Pseudomonas typographi TaxID=2715964 RepID=A0ABR7Z4L3_9PSED|nr:M20 family metallopeptidase [Pseudomonas typographi]MBD1552942.1 M20 family metallopeptidase [Pseudomonas typographi]MBD1600288.1 M20 family metallopeptidase [Pseudomonas typographi]